MYKTTILVILLFFSHVTSARNNVYYPNFFSSYFYNLYQATPSFIHTDSLKLRLSANYKSLFGEFKKISVYSFSVSRDFRSDKNTVRSIRMSFFNEKEGDFISNPRFYVGYSQQIKISNEVDVVVGANIGMSGLNYSAPTITQRSVVLPDAGLGISTKWKDTQIGLSSNQVLNSAKYIYTSPVTLQRYWHVHGSQDLKISENFDLKFSSIYRILPYVKDEFFVSAGSEYKKQFCVGLGYKYAAGFSFYTCFKLSKEENKLQLFFNYNSSAFKLAPRWQNNLEFGINYGLK